MGEPASLLDFGFQLIILNPALAGIFILILLSGYLTFFVHYRVNRWRYFENLELWEKPLWIMIIGLLNTVHALWVLAIVFVMIVSLGSIGSVKGTDLSFYFITVLFVIPASELFSFLQKTDRVPGFSFFSSRILGTVVSAGAVVSAHLIVYNQPIPSFVILIVTILIATYIMYPTLIAFLINKYRMYKKN